MAAAARLRLQRPLLFPTRTIDDSLAQAPASAPVGEERFVFVGLLSAMPGTTRRSCSRCFAAVAFSLAASAVYVGNDIVDRERDRQHPDKRRRPLASGAITPGSRWPSVSAACWRRWVLPGWLHPAVAAIIVAYLLLNIGYTLGLKHIVLLDVFIISAGFMLRILAGTLGVGIAPSHWLLLCGFMVTLFLGSPSAGRS